MADYGGEGEYYISVDDLPKEKLAGGKSAYAWEEFDYDLGGFPPATIKQNKNGTISIVDGNHRIARWREEGRDYVPVRVVKGRNGESLQRQMEAEGDIRFSASKAPPVESAAFKKWFGNSKVVDENGEPMVVYHSTKGDFSTFRQDAGVSRRGSDFGFHFANSPENAEEAIMPGFARRYNEGIISDPASEDWQKERSRNDIAGYYESASIMPVYLRAERPVRLPDMGRWDQPGNVRAALYHDAYYTGGPRLKPNLDTSDTALAQRLLDAADKTTDRSEWVLKFKNLLVEAGYDSILYENKTEGGDSVMVWDAGQIKSAIGNVGTYDINNPDIRFSAPAPATDFDTASVDHAALKELKLKREAAKARREVARQTARLAEATPGSKEAGNIQKRIDAKRRSFLRIYNERLSELKPSAFPRQYGEFKEVNNTLGRRARSSFRRWFSPGGNLPREVFDAMIDRNTGFSEEEMVTRDMVMRLEAAVKEDYGVPYRNLDEGERERILSIMRHDGLDPTLSKDDMLAEIVRMESVLPSNVREVVVSMREGIDRLSQDMVGLMRQDIDQMLLSGDVRYSVHTRGNPDDEVKSFKTLAEAETFARVSNGRDPGRNLVVRQAASPQLQARVDLLRTIMDNMEKYVHRSYQSFDDPDWFEKIPKKVYDDAMKYLVDQYTDMKGVKNPEKRAELVISELVKTKGAYDSMESFIKETKLGARDLSLLKYRNDIAKPIRELLGEYKDPRLAYARTVTKQYRYIFNTQFLRRVRQEGLGQFFWEKDERPQSATVQFAAKNNKTLEPLNGLWTTPEVAQAFTDVLDQENLENWYRMVVKANGYVKMGKTVLSPTTMFRNWMSAAFFTINSAHFDYQHMKTAAAGLREYMTHAGKDGKLEYLRKLHRLGVIYDNPYAGELMRLLEDATYGDSIFGSSQRMKDWILKWPTRMYQFGDDFWKIIGYETEKRVLMKYGGLSEEAAEKEAAQRIRDTYPTYSMVGLAMQKLRRFPLAGTFVSFPAEIIRTTFNSMKYIRKDWNTPGMRPRAIQRMIGMSIVASFAYALQEALKSLYDVDDDEEEAARIVGAPWNRNSNLWFMGRDEQGHLQYIDGSFLDPYNYLKRPFTALMRDQPIDDALVSATADMLSPFLGTDIAFTGIYEVLANKRKDTGSPVYAEHAPIDDRAGDIAMHLWKTFRPGVAANADRMWKAFDGHVSSSGRTYNLDEEMAGFFGFRVTTLEPKTALYFRTRDFIDALADSTNLLTSTLKSPNEVSPAEMADARAVSQEVREKAFTDMSTLIHAVRRSGMADNEIMKTLNDAGLSRKNVLALMRGEVPRWRPTRSSIRSATRRARSLLDDSRSRRIYERYLEAARDQ